MYMRLILSFLKQHCTFYISNNKYLPQDKKRSFLRWWQSKIFCTLQAQSPYYKKIRVNNWKSGNCEGDELTFLFIFYRGCLVVQARYHLKMLFESVVMGSDHPSSRRTIMTSDISLLSTYLVILIPRIDSLPINKSMNLAHFVPVRGLGNQLAIATLERRVIRYSRDSEMVEEPHCLKVKSDVRTSTSEFDGEYGVVPWMKHNSRIFGVFDFRKAGRIFHLCGLPSF